MKLASLSLLFCIGAIIAHPVPNEDESAHGSSSLTSEHHSGNSSLASPENEKSSPDSHSAVTHSSHSLSDSDNAHGSAHSSHSLSDSDNTHGPAHSSHSLSDSDNVHGSAHSSHSLSDSDNAHGSAHSNSFGSDTHTHLLQGENLPSAFSAMDNGVNDHSQMSSLSAPAMSNPSMGEINQMGDSSDISKRTQLFVYQCVRAMPSFSGNLRKIQEAILNCSINAWALALREQPSATPIRNLYDSLVKEQKQEAQLGQDKCAQDSVNHFLGIDLLFSTPAPNCMKTLSSCVSGVKAKLNSDAEGSFSSRMYCLSDAYMCIAPSYSNTDQKLFNVARLAADKFTKLSLAFTGNQKCEKNNTHCVWNTGCGGTELVRDWFQLSLRLESPSAMALPTTLPTGLPPVASLPIGMASAAGKMSTQSMPPQPMTGAPQNMPPMGALPQGKTQGNLTPMGMPPPGQPNQNAPGANTTGSTTQKLTTAPLQDPATTMPSVSNQMSLVPNQMASMGAASKDMPSTGMPPTQSSDSQGPTQLSEESDME